MAKRVNKKATARKTPVKGKTETKPTLGGKGKIHEHPNANTAGFTQNPQNAGRPKKIYTILKESGFSADDIRTAFGEVAWYNIKELEDLFKKDDTPVILKVIANAFRQAAKDGKYLYIKEILEQHMGKAPASLDVTTGGEKLGAKDTSNLSDKELIAYNNLLKKISKEDA